jgi:hypothetical protein
MPLAPDDEAWTSLKGGYRLPYDPRLAVEALRSPSQRERAWEELWSELHHQGDVGEASYVAVPLLVQVRSSCPDLGWQFYSLCATVETERNRKKNPPLPLWLVQEYEESWKMILSFALSDLRTSTDPLLVRAALSAVALAKGEAKLGAMIGFLDESEIAEWAEKNLAWSELYRPAV